MARRQHKPEGIVAKLRQVEVLVGQGRTMADGARAIGVTEAMYHRWRSECGALKLDQVRRLRLLEQESTQLRRAVSDLTPEWLRKPPRETPERCPSPGGRGTRHDDPRSLGTPGRVGC